MLVYTFIFSSFLVVLGTINLSILKEENGMRVPVMNMVEVRKGASLMLTCTVTYGNSLGNLTIWKRFNYTLGQYKMQLKAVKLKDEGEYACESQVFRLWKMVYVRVLPKLISPQLKKKVYNWIYPIRRKRFTDSSSSDSSSESKENSSKQATPDDHREFWIVVIIILTIAVGIFATYYILRRYWWNNNRRRPCSQREQCRESGSSPEVVYEISENDSIPLGNADCDLPPSYSDNFDTNDLPPSYEEAISNENFVHSSNKQP